MTAADVSCEKDKGKSKGEGGIYIGSLNYKLSSPLSLPPTPPETIHDTNIESNAISTRASSTYRESLQACGVAL